MRTKSHRPGLVHRALRLQHHQHTGSKLAHKHTSYRALALVLVVAGLSIMGLNAMARATADAVSGDLHVYARNPAPIPTDAATITSPTDGTVTNHSGTTISGTCPAITPRVIVVITDNGIEAGSVACDASNTFSINITLAPGDHVLVAKTYTITDDTGPDSTPVAIRYVAIAEPPKPPAPPTINDTVTSYETLAVAINHPFIIFGPAKDAIWNGTITGGQLPYRVRIAWGDGSARTYTINKEGDQSFSHHYTSMQPHDIIFRVTSADGQYVTRHYAAVTPYTPPVGLLNATPGPWNGSSPLGIYGLYLVLLALFGYLWLRRHPFAYAKVPVHHRSYAVTKHRKRAR